MEDLANIFQTIWDYYKVLTPILFSMYINDIEIKFIKENCPSVDIQLINIFFLMYADDKEIKHASSCLL